LGEQLKAREHHERELMALIEKKDEQIELLLSALATSIKAMNLQSARARLWRYIRTRILIKGKYSGSLLYISLAVQSKPTSACRPGTTGRYAATTRGQSTGRAVGDGESRRALQMPIYSASSGSNTTNWAGRLDMCM
jgi:hypothetical protein